MASTPKTKSNSNILYLSDVVASEKNNIGVIIEMPDSDSDDDTEDEGLPKEAAMVSWYPNGDEEVLEQKDLQLKSRVLDPGMGVERVGDFRSGVLLDVSATCTIRLIGTNTVLSQVPGSMLTPWNLHYHEPNVVLGSWLGYILQLQQTLVVGLKNGARVLMKFDTARHMEDSKFSEISPYYSGTWYVGQKLEGKARWFKRATLLSGTMPVFKSLKAKVKGIVLEAILTGIEVEWIMHGFMNTKKLATPPPSLITGEQMLKKIRVFERYQQRFLTIGLPALLKINKKYDIQELIREVQAREGVLPEMEVEGNSEVPVHQCTQQNTATKGSELDEEEEDKDVNCNEGETSHLMFETKIDDRTSAEVAKVEEQLAARAPSAVDPSAVDPSAPEEILVCGENEETAAEKSEEEIQEKRNIFASGDTDSEDESENEEENHSDSSSEQSDSGLDDSLEAARLEKEEKREKERESEESTTSTAAPPGDQGAAAPGEQGQEIQGTPNATTQVSDKPARKRLVKRARNTRNTGWCQNVAPKGPIRVKGSYLCEIVDAKYTGKVLWEDGTREEVPCTALNQIDHLDDHAHMPGYFVNRVGNTEELAVVSKYNSKDRTCNVHWLDTDKTEEDVSVYSLEFNRKFDFNPMDIIVCLVECAHSSIGQIVYVTDTGKLLVHWTDRSVSTIAPDKCVHLGSSDTDYEDLSDDDYAEAEDDDSSSWMTADSDFFSEQELDDEDKAKWEEERAKLYEDAQQVEELEKLGEEDPKEETQPRLVVSGTQLPTGEGPAGGGSNEQDPTAEDESSKNISKEDSSENKKAEILEGLERGEEFVQTISEMDSHDESTYNVVRKRFRNGRTSYVPCEPHEICEPQELSAALQEHANIISESFKMMPKCPGSHHYYTHSQPGSYQRAFLNAVRKDIKLISSSLPDGIWVRAYEDRMDLLCCLIEGPEDTPYHGVLFVCDIQLPSNYSTGPPLLHYCSYSATKLNPNLYPEGKVCLSLLGTWMGKGTEQWTKSSNLLQLFVSIQSLVLNSTPYYNEAGFNKYKETQSGEMNAKLYNEMIVFKILEHISSMYAHPHEAFAKEITSYYIVNVPKTLERYNKFIKCSQENTTEECGISYPLLPLSKGVIPCIQTRLNPLKIIAAVDLVYLKLDADEMAVETTSDATTPVEAPTSSDAPTPADAPTSSDALGPADAPTSSDAPATDCKTGQNCTQNTSGHVAAVELEESGSTTETVPCSSQGTVNGKEAGDQEHIGNPTER